jgi:hypothetical protein
MKNLLYSINIILFFLLMQSCNNSRCVSNTSSKPTPPGGQTTGQHKEGNTSTPIDMSEPSNDTTITPSPRIEIKHGSEDQEKIDSLKRANMKKKKGG